MINKIILISAICMCFSNTVNGQAWERFYGFVNSYEHISGFHNSYDNGYLFNVLSKVYQGKTMSLIFKIDINGDTLWSKSIKHDVSIVTHKIRSTSDGGMLICGSYYFENSFNSDPFIIKLNSCAELEWCKIFTTDQILSAATDLIVLESGDFLLLLNNFGDYDTEKAFLVKLDQFGEVIWGKPVINHELYPNSFAPLMLNMIIVNNENVLVSGDAYWKNPWDDRNLTRPTFALYDINGNEKWVTPFGIADSLIGRGNYCIELNSGIFLCTGRHLTLGSGLQNGYLILLDSNGVVLNFRIVTPEDINGEWYSLFFDQLEVFDSSIVLNLSYLVSSTQGYPGLINIGNGIFEGEITVNALELFPQMRYPHKLFRDTDDKLFYGTQYRLNAYDYDIYLRKMNSMLQVDSLEPNLYTYDSLCPYPITYSEIILDDCDLIDILSGVHEPQIKHSNNLFRIIVSPNPVPDKMYLKYPDAHKVHGTHISIFNSKGQVVENYNLGTKQETVHDIHHWPSGLYFIVAFNQGLSVGMSKFVKL
jgi:hypothetical protein